MARSACIFRQADVTRAVKGAAAGGLLVTRVEIDQVTGRIVVHSSNGVAAEQSVEAPLDEWLASHARQA